MSREVWIVVEVYAGVPERLWVRRSEESARRTADAVAEREGFYYDEEHRYWMRGEDAEIHLRTGDLEPEGSG